MIRQPQRVVTLRPDSVRNVLLLGVAILVALDLCMAVLNYGLGHDTVLGLAGFLELDAEDNLPARYNALLLFAAAASCWVVAWIGAPRRGTWTALGLLFGFLTVDEWMSLHERLAVPVRDALDTSGLLYTAWIIPYAAGGLVVLLLLLPWLRQLPRPTRRGCVVSAATYLSGAIGVEAISGAYRSAMGFAGEFDFTYDLLSTIEESLEMLGIVLFVHCVLRYASSLSKGVRIVPPVGKPSAPESPAP